MAVHAHPDDESSKGAATMARYVREGMEVLVCTLTGGERGSVLNPKMDRPEIVANIAEIRRAEMARAREILGVEQRFLGFVDSGLPENEDEALPEGCFALQKLEDASAPLVAAVREFRPHVIITYDDDGGYPHPDHIMTNKVSVEAFEAAGDPDRYPGTGEPWQPLKMYYTTWSMARIKAMHEKFLELGLESPYGEGWFTRPSTDDKVTTRIEVGDYYQVRVDALLAHGTQVDPNERFWFGLPVEVARTVHPWDDYMLARSLVTTEIPEDDLFAGVREFVGSSR
jgi:mycothiol S-conjugate amidase